VQLVLLVKLDQPEVMDQRDQMEKRGLLGQLELLGLLGLLEEEEQQGRLERLALLETGGQLDVMEERGRMETLVGEGQVVQLVLREGMVLLVGGGDMEILDQLEEPVLLDQLVFRVIYLKQLLQIRLHYLYH
jgi:hypothetical protein